MSLSYGDTKDSLKNRKVFLDNLGIDYRNLVCAKQVHANKIFYAHEQDKGKGALSYETAIADTDAFITDRKNVPLAIFTADCLSIFLYAQQIPAIGLVHAGWRSTKANIASLAVKLMQDKFGLAAEELQAIFGPAIKDCCFEVKDNLQDFACGLVERNEKTYFDLTGVNKLQLLDSGLKEENILDLGLCTSCRNSDSFSYRKEGKDCGRMISVIMLV